MSLFTHKEVAFVTGAASGIGRATALQFVTDGVRHITLVDISDEGLKETVSLLAAKNGDAEAIAIVADVSRADDVDRAVTETVAKFGRIDYCVNSAGTGGLFGPITEQKEETLDRTLSINVKGIWLCERAQIAQMLKQDLRPLNTGLPFETRGSIVHIGSILGQIAMPTLGPYAISKHAVNGIVKTDALDYAKDKIRINAVCPGFVRTNFVPPEMWASLDPVIAATPIQRLGTPEELAFTAVFVASDRASYMTGSMVNADGGYTAQIVVAPDKAATNDTISSVIQNNLPYSAISIMTSSVAQHYNKHFIPLESNPEVFTELIHKLGITKSLSFQDVLSLDDPELLGFLPRPVHALILIFPTAEAYERRVSVEDLGAKDYLDGSDTEDVVFFRQTINNACGLYAILHAVCNGDARNSFGTNSPMHHLLKNCLPEQPRQRAQALECDEKLERVYAEVAVKGDTEAPANAEDVVDFHYIAFAKSHINGHLYQLDGDRKRPIRLDLLDDGEDVLSEKCLTVIRRMMTGDGDSPNFSLMALVGET